MKEYRFERKKEDDRMPRKGIGFTGDYRSQHQDQQKIISQMSGTPTEEYLQKLQKFEIDYSTAMIGQDKKEKSPNYGETGAPKEPRYRSDNLRLAMVASFEKTGKVPYTLSAYLLMHESGSPWTKELNMKFIQNVIERKIPVIITSGYWVDNINVLKPPPLYTGAVTKTQEEIRYLLSNGYQFNKNVLEYKGVGVGSSSDEGKSIEEEKVK